MGSIERLLLYYNEKDMLKNKESGEPDSRAEARLLQQPYFLSAECASCPEGLLCNRNTFLLYNKYPDMSIVYHTGIPSIYKIFYYDFLLCLRK